MLIVLGKKIITNKTTGKVGTVVSFIADFEDWEQNTEGQRCLEEYFVGIPECELGDEVSINYVKGFKGMAKAESITVL